MPTDLLLSLAAGLASVLVVVVTQFLMLLRRKEKRLMEEEIEQISKVLKAEGEARKPAVLEIAAEKVPSGLSPEQFSSLLKEITARLPEPGPESAQQTAVESLISGYHEQALSQARAQFWFSVVAATIGFVWILYAGMDIKAKDITTLSKTFPGVVLDAVAFLFFRQASDTRQRATDLYDRLRRDKQVSESVSLVSSIEDVRVRSAVKAQIALHMAGLQPAPIELTRFLSSEANETQQQVQPRPCLRGGRAAAEPARWAAYHLGHLPAVAR